MTATSMAQREPTSRRRTSVPRGSKPPTVRCAIYTRKSSEEGLAQEFNSLDAQREAAEAYIASQKAEGWVALPDRYDDGGYTGGNMERPALRRLLTDVEAGKIDCIVVYKVDRLSRSLMDFARIMEAFDKHTVSFVSVTQHFNTTHSMGRLTLNILLSFAQFEREIIGERIRDKIAASRQRGKWTGGTPILGYDVDRSSGNPRLVVNPAEAAKVREIFDMYLERGTLLAVVAELEQRAWRSKTWLTRAGQPKGGEAFDKCRLHALLTNVLYVGKVRHKDQVYAGEHDAIVPEALFQRVQARLHQNRNGTGPELRNRHGSLLRGLLYCRACDRALVHTFASRGTKRYRYYTCTNAIKNGRRKCPVGSLPAGEIEKAVVDQIRCIGQDAGLLAETLRQARAQTDEAIGRLEDQRRLVTRGLARCHEAIQRTVSNPPAEQDRVIGANAGPVATRLAELTDQATQAERQLAEIDGQLGELRRDLVTEADVRAAFADFENVWAALLPREQVQVLHLLIHRVEFDAADSSIEITFYPVGIKSLAGKATERPQGPASDSPTRHDPTPRSRHTKRARRAKEAAA